MDPTYNSFSIPRRPRSGPGTQQPPRRPRAALAEAARSGPLRGSRGQAEGRGRGGGGGGAGAGPERAGRPAGQGAGVGGRGSGAEPEGAGRWGRGGAGGGGGAFQWLGGRLGLRRPGFQDHLGPPDVFSVFSDY